MTNAFYESVKTAMWIISFLLVFVYVQHKDVQDEVQSNYVKALESIVDKCTNRGDNAIWVDNELWMCGATPTGVKL